MHVFANHKLMSFVCEQFSERSSGARYTVLSQIGGGSFGTIFKAWDHKTRTCVAIKNLSNAFGSRSGRHHALRELAILRQSM